MRRPLVSAAFVLMIGVLSQSTPAANAAGQHENPLANLSFVCEGGNESAGHDYYFNTKVASVERIDYRFPQRGVVFEFGGATEGKLTPNWSFETLSDVSEDRIMLYERVSLRTESQNKHVYRTYEIYRQSGNVYMVLYDGVNGARDWTYKTTRPCGTKKGNKIVQPSARKYWSTTMMR
ncbi:hypothetical protein SAMN04515647_2766 [Cohaesibacter sp. ES.047]|uniref:hypothetical protein n=1 Tax=Cohaesibacter sp. ES.047 TaxID=1798205 RepID=UPI000BBF6DD7|nr:hypothetical protein [Cohaesibacter sp. ES.047]SNY92493.1 hypothetical protein SAMN04515647_2766 [Cohaesibacter sp. ES.047]